jgi:hypothetical protein
MTYYLQRVASQNTADTQQCASDLFIAATGSCPFNKVVVAPATGAQYVVTTAPQTNAPPAASHTL